MDSPGQLVYSRRAFLRGVAGFSLLSGAAPLIAACASVKLPSADDLPPSSAAKGEPMSTPATSSVRQVTGEESRVAFVKTSDRSAGVRQALALLAPSFAGQHIFLKPNFNSADPAPGSTHPAVLQTLVEELWTRQARTITVGERSGMGDTRRVMDQLGVFELAKRLDFEPVVLDELAKQDWEMVELPEAHWQRGFPLTRLALEADAVVQTGCQNPPHFVGHFPLTHKNAAGLVAKSRPAEPYNYMNELHGSSQQRRMIAEINAAYTPALIVLDGVDAFVNGGPHAGARVAANVVLAGTDRIAIDAVGVALLRHFGSTPQVMAGPIFAQEQIARAVELGLGVNGPEQIELVTPDAASEAYAAEIRKLLA